jgi:RHS repeat-associated protein
MQDANWNVTGIVNTSGNVIERYKYDPYGAVTVLNGASDHDSEVSDWSADADNTSDWKWVYYFQGLWWDNDAKLLRADDRDLSVTLGRWMQEDPNPAGVYADGMNWYQAYASNPVNRRDPSGTITVRTVYNKPSFAGSYDAGWNFILDEPAPEDGYIVQKVTQKWTIYKLDNDGDPANVDEGELIYWEAWFVKGGQRLPLDAITAWGVTDRGQHDRAPGTNGVQSQEGEIKFFTICGILGNFNSDPKLWPEAPGWGFGKVPNSNDLPSTDKEPLWWDNRNEDPPNGSRSVWVSWNNSPNDGFQNNFDGDHGYPDVTPALPQMPKKRVPPPPLGHEL